MSRKKSQPTQTKASSKTTPGLSKFGLFAVLVVVAGAAGFSFVQMNKYKQDSANLSGAARLAQNGNTNGLSNLFGKKVVPTVATVTPVPTITPRPTMVPKPLPKGQQEYSIRQGDGFKGPKFVSAKVSSYALTKDTKQTVTVFIDKTKSATQFTGSLVSDTKQTPLNFVSMGEENNLQKWQAEWSLSDDTFNKNYSFAFIAIGAGGQSKASIGER